MRYTTLLFDFDHTLLDSDESERLAYAHTMETIGLTDPDDHFGRYVTINREMWVAVEAGELQPAEVRHRRFERFVDELDIDADPHAMADEFVFGLGAYGELYDGARAVLDELAASTRLAMITNGLSMVQRTRIDRLGLDELFEVVIISEEVGVTKPRPEIFDHAFRGLGQPERTVVLMIGDSLTSDIRGGADYGVDTCWFNRHAQVRPAEPKITHEIADLGALATVVTGA